MEAKTCKDIDINNEDEILKECNFEYFYNSEECSRELCKFFNDIFVLPIKFNKQQIQIDFDKRQAQIDLGRIGITLNKQAKEISELKSQLAENEKLLKKYDELNLKYCAEMDKVIDLQQQIKELKEN